MSELIEYLDCILVARKSVKRPKGIDGWPYCCLEEFVRLEGTAFTPPSSPELTNGVERGVVKECYSNCWNHLASNPGCGLAYCEGYANGIIPIMHAWLLAPDGTTVIDPTWPEPGTEYFGVAFRWDFAFETVMGKETYGVIDDWRNDWPLMQGVDPVKWKREELENAR